MRYPHSTVTHLRLLLISGDGGPGQVPVAQVVTGGVSQGPDKHLGLLCTQTLLQLGGTHLACLAPVLVNEISLAVILVSVATH